MSSLPSRTGSIALPHGRSAARPVRAPARRSRASLTPSTRRTLLVYAASFLIHSFALAALGLVVLPSSFHERIFTIFARRGEPGEELVTTFDTVLLPELLVENATNSAAAATGEQSDDPASTALPGDALEPTLKPELDVPGPPIDLANATSGRTGSLKQSLLRKFGGSEASEAAVNRGLEWLASIQRPDGSWSFHEIGEAPNPGTVHAGTEMGATACALLAFLGAGHTHQHAGPWRNVVSRGLDYLLVGGKVTSAGGDYRGDIPHDSHAGMYIQGLVSIALAESFAMTADPRLKRHVENATRFIASAQDRRRGGWRYTPGRDSDTSVVGWQLMALKSAQSKEIKIPSKVFTETNRFLDSVSALNGAHYGYKRPDLDRPSTSAIGLLCRMYLGWERDHSGLAAGVTHLSSLGPDFNDLYYVYYATQVLHHWGGDEWNAWNIRTRDGLVARQVTEGSWAGSWNPGGTHAGQSGGRLFDTCLAIMTLEVYYRHLPLYDREDLKVEY